MAEILLMFSFGVAYPDDSFFLRLLSRFQKVNKVKFGKAKEKEFFKAIMDPLTVLSIWDTAGSSSMISHCHGTC